MEKRKEIIADILAITIISIILIASLTVSVLKAIAFWKIATS